MQHNTTSSQPFAKLLVISRFISWLMRIKLEAKRKAIEAKYRNLYMLLDLDWNGYLMLQKLKHEEMLKNGL